MTTTVHTENASDVLSLAERAADRLLPAGATWDRPRLLDTDLHVVRAGRVRDLPPVVLLHHWFGNAHTWRHVTDALAADTAVIAHDRPGFGWSHREHGRGRDWSSPYTRAHAADLLAALLDHDGHDRVVIVGVSAGGTAALEFLHRYPERVAGLALISPAVTGDLGVPQALRPLLRRGFGSAVAGAVIRSQRGAITPSRIANSWGDPSRATAEDAAAYDLAFAGPGWAQALWATMVADPTPDLRHVFGQVRVPSLFVNGLRDQIIRPSWTKNAADATSGSQWLPLPGVGHTPQEERPDLLVPALRELLSRV